MSEGGSPTLFRVDLDGASEVLDVPLDHVHADPAAGDIADLFGGGEARVEDQVMDLLVGELLVLADQSSFLGLCEDPIDSQPAAVVTDLDDDVPTLVEGAQTDGPGLGLAGRAALVG